MSEHSLWSIVLLLACVVAVALAGLDLVDPAQNDEVVTLFKYPVVNDTTSLVTTLRELGWSTSVVGDSAMVEKATRKFTLGLSEMPDNAFSLVLFSGAWESRESTVRGQLLLWCNSWNRGHTLSRCYINDQNAPVLEFELILPVTSAVFERFTNQMSVTTESYVKELIDRLDLLPIATK